MLSERTKLITSSQTAATRSIVKKLVEQGVDIIDLSAGELTCETSEIIKKAAIKAILLGNNRYTDTIGIIHLRELIASHLEAETQQPWTKDEIALTAGAKQALFNAAMVLLNPGDEVIIPVPYWTTFPAQTYLANAVPVLVDTSLYNYQLNAEQIINAITPKTKAIVLNTPNNPTGAVYEELTLKKIIDVAVQKNIFIIYDICYSKFIYSPSKYVNIINLHPEGKNHTIIINSFSKSLALTGWRIGYVAAPKYIIDAIKALQSHTTSNPNTIAQRLCRIC